MDNPETFAARRIAIRSSARGGTGTELATSIVAISVFGLALVA